MLSRIFRDSENSAVNRKRQIDTLKVFNDNVIEIEEDAEYRVEFSAGGRDMAIIVSLSPEFPLEKPVLKVTPDIDHPWISESNEIVSAPGLLNFTVHSDLGRVVQAIIREFERSPPPIVGETNVVSASPAQPRVLQEACSSGRTSPVTMYRVEFLEMLEMSNEELEQLKENEDLLDEFISKLGIMQKQNKALEDMITRNEQLAKENLSKQPHLETLSNTVASKLETVADLKATYDKLSCKYQQLADNYTPSNIKESMKLAAMRSDEESEKIAERFLSGKDSVDQFVNKYVQKRMISQIRKTKEEKLGNQLNELQRAGY
ncbi:hypothetical protein L9F63_000540 [Diploptera punctata]|uniref:VPS37 C-terminal domain-containing protein n=1 Tax=Diploptera punctata TaxID=6984 RepID=A0AAD8ESM0_DIPPU|nr:hypothetical protein L9F63_000540 [Diploptera punctata]